MFVTIVPLALLTSTAYSRHAEFGRYLAYENSLKLARRVLFQDNVSHNVSLCCPNSYDSFSLHVLSTKRGAVFCFNYLLVSSIEPICAVDWSIILS